MTLQVGILNTFQNKAFPKNTFFETDARFAGESIAELFNKPHYC